MNASELSELLAHSFGHRNCDVTLDVRRRRGFQCPLVPAARIFAPFPTIPDQTEIRSEVRRARLKSPVISRNYLPESLGTR